MHMYLRCLSCALLYGLRSTYTLVGGRSQELSKNSEGRSFNNRAKACPTGSLFSELPTRPRMARGVVNFIAGEEVVAVASGEWDDMARSGVETV